jgi:hypothetical protein
MNSLWNIMYTKRQVMTFIDMNAKNDIMKVEEIMNKNNLFSYFFDLF